MKPITPAEVAAQRVTDLPPEVIEEWNKAIAEKFDGRTAVIGQIDMVGRLAERMKVERIKVFAECWLNVEHVFRAAGWSVEYDKPGYNETYEPTFTFRVRS